MANKTIAQIRKETETNCTFDDFNVGTRVKVTVPCVDFHFFNGETGMVIKNSGRYLGIIVQFDKPRKFEDGSVQETFNFNPKDLLPIGEAEVKKRVVNPETKGALKMAREIDELEKEVEILSQENYIMRIALKTLGVNLAVLGISEDISVELRKDD